jgi:hypothetical protein
MRTRQGGGDKFLGKKARAGFLEAWEFGSTVDPEPYPFRPQERTQELPHAACRADLLLLILSGALTRCGEKVDQTVVDQAFDVELQRAEMADRTARALPLLPTDGDTARCRRHPNARDMAQVPAGDA